MGKETGISWTDHTFNPWWGCEKVSPACDSCYAESTANRYGPKVWGKDAPRRFFGDKHWNEPIGWDKKASKEGVRRRVFCASMADVFEDRRELDKARLLLWDVIEATPDLDWLLLSKRPENFRAMLPPSWMILPRLNVWLGVTAENQRRADERIPLLLKTPAVVRFVSAEPLLEPVNFSRFRDGLDWVIVGGESGPGCRPMEVKWATDILHQSRAMGFAYFMKQLGGHPDKRKEPEQWPDVLAVQEFPVPSKL